MNTHIDKFLNYYYKLESPEYAVMLKGKWGSGKTHYIKKFKQKLDKNRQKYIYVSLYGITSYDEIETKFLEVMFPKLYNKKSLFLGKIVKGALNATFRLDLNANSKDDTNLGVKVPELADNDLVKIFNTEQYILIFDDVERCAIDINNLLGYINYFVEHQSYRVILIANEEELEKDNKYKQIREKLIGKTFELVSNVDIAYNSFVGNLKEEESKAIFREYRETILDVYKASEYDNLRLLRQTILDFDRFYQELNLKEYQDTKSLIEQLIKLFFIFSIENKFEYDIAKFEEYKKNISLNYMNRNKKDEELLEVGFVGKFDINFYERIFEVDLWVDIINRSIIDKEKITKALSEYSNIKDENWYQLWSFSNLEDDNEFRKLTELVMNDLEKKTFKHITTIRHVYSILIYLIDNDLLDKEKSEILKLTQAQIDFLLEHGNTTQFIVDRFNHNGANGLSYQKISDEDTQNLLLYLAEKHEEIMKKDTTSLIEYLDKENFYELVDKNFKIYWDRPILHIIDVEQFVEKFLSLSFKNRVNISYFWYERYNDRVMVKELEFLKSLKTKLLEENEKQKSNLNAYHIKYFIIQRLNPAIEQLESYQNQDNSVGLEAHPTQLGEGNE